MKLKTTTKKRSVKPISKQMLDKKVAESQGIGFDRGYALALFDVLLISDNGKLIGSLYIDWHNSTDDCSIIFEHIDGWDSHEVNCQLFEKIIWSLKEADADSGIVNYVKLNYNLFRNGND